MTFAELLTPGGYKCGEVASAFQKCIRRADEDGALFWGTELDLAGYSEYVWKRLRIIASEDVGLSQPGVVSDLRALYVNWLDQRKKNDKHHAPERLYLVHAIMLLARALKSRAVDHALIHFYEGKRDGREVPDFALDKHTARGRARRRGWKHFFTEGCYLHPRAEVSDRYEESAKVIRQDSQTELDL